DLTRRRAVAVQRLVHLARRKEQVGTAGIGYQEAESVGMALDGAGDEIELGDDAKLAFAIRHQLPVALHRREPSGKCLALRRAAHAKRCDKIVGAHRRAALAQEFENALAVRNVDIAATTRRWTRRGVRCYGGVRPPQLL